MENIFTILFIALLFVHTYTDLRYMLLYDSITLLLAATGIIRAVYLAQCVPVLQSAGLMLTIMLVIYFVSRGGMGEGDVKLAPALGLWLSLEQGVLCLLLAFVSGAVVGGGLLLGGKSRRCALPFGPFLCLGAIAAYFLSKEIIWWYWQIMLNYA